MFEKFTSKELMGNLPQTRQHIEQLAASGQKIEFHPTILLGLLSEADCFKAIKEMGDAKFYLKDQLKEEMKKKVADQPLRDRLTAAINQVHKNQLIVINDVCERFHVIHPTMEKPTDEMLEHYTQYWDWYSDQHLKVYGSRPEIPKEFLKKKSTDKRLSTQK